MAHRPGANQPSPAPPSGQPPAHGTVAVINAPDSIDQAQQVVAAAAEQRGYAKASVFAIKLSLHEALVNAFKHGHKDLPADTPVTLTYRVGEVEVDLRITDQGPGFDPDAVPDPTLEENLERGSGRGLLLIRAYMSKVEFNRKGNEMRMVYRKPAAKA